MNIAMILIDGLISIYCFAKNQKNETRKYR